MSEGLGLVWRRSQCDTNACVEIATTEDHVWVRNSRDPNGPHLTFTHAEWVTFVRWIRDEPEIPSAA